MSVETADNLKIFEGLELTGRVNVADETLLAQVRGAVRRGHPQVSHQPVKPDRIALVCSGPSLHDTFDELRGMVWRGAKLVAVNGAYAWCLERNLKPSAHVVLDARASSARFVTPEVPGCRYYLASQCHPDVWDAVAGFEHVGIWHAVAGDGDDSPLRALLNEFYAGRWSGVAGGTTVGTRAIGLLRMLGYLRFDIFGMDSCWRGDEHHAFDQPENAADRRVRLTLAPLDDARQPVNALARTFECAPWHVKQFEDVMQFIRFAGQHFLLNFHGDGMIAYAVNSQAELAVQTAEE